MYVLFARFVRPLERLVAAEKRSLCVARKGDSPVLSWKSNRGYPDQLSGIPTAQWVLKENNPPFQLTARSNYERGGGSLKTRSPRLRHNVLR